MSSLLNRSSYDGQNSHGVRRTPIPNGTGEVSDGLGNVNSCNLNWFYSAEQIPGKEDTLSGNGGAPKEEIVPDITQGETIYATEA